MEWEKLLSTKLQMEHPSVPQSWSVYSVDEFENDYRRIISSEEFRALQDKMQVLSLQKSDFVRTRLTHSLEVSSIGRQLGTMVARNARKNEKTNLFGDKSELYARYFSTILSTAGLLHDLGNSPFGHFGEEAIGNWFRQRFEDDGFEYKGRPVREILSEQMKKDLIGFNGNSQTLRILSRPYRDGVSSELDVTCSVINSLMKYPTTSLTMDPSGNDGRMKKMGCFLSEEDFFNSVRSECGLKNNEMYPLAFLLEASDDIGYVISDLEDVINEKVVSELELVRFCNKAFAQMREECEKAGMTEEEDLQLMITEDLLKKQEKAVMQEGTDEERLRRTIRFLQFAKKWFIYSAADTFVKCYDQIMDGSFRGELLEEGFHSKTIKIYKQLMARYVYTELDKLKTELAGSRIIMELMDRFIPACIYWQEDDCTEKQNRIDTSYMKIFPSKYLGDYEQRKTDDDAYNLYLRFHMIIDYISGLTDSKAKKLYQELTGF
ncbi:MAG: dNTP triphosphohydrolase [Clostridia bacterium]|nr:dNTP triphosphohydrolase [Clostridia bacterium]